jgi:putative flavoprotein involved in K+ transport
MGTVVVCGAGPAGLGAAASLRRAGLETLVVERSNRVAASWRSRYPALRLNTTGWMSGQPGLRAKVRRYGEFPSRDKWVQYLEDYAAHHRLDLRFGTEVRRIARADAGWRVETGGDALEAPAAVVATGFDREPYMPEWPGREGFSGELIHASAYQDPGPYRGKDVLVVGPGVTGSEVAHLVATGGAARVRVACRTPPHIVRRKFLGSSVQITGAVLHHLPLWLADGMSNAAERLQMGNLSRYGLPRPRMGMATMMAKQHQSPAFDDGFVDSVKAGRIEIVSAVEGFNGADVLLADGSRVQPDAVIAATGYRRGLEPLVGHLGVLDEDGTPFVHGGREDPSAPNLFFTGYRTELSGQLRLMRFDARSIARALSKRRR